MTGEGFKQIEITTYAETTKMPFMVEISTYDPTGALYVSTRRMFSYDSYRNLLAEVVDHVEGTETGVLSSTINQYDGAKYHAQTYSESMVDADKTVRTQNNVDALGRITGSTKDLCTRTSGGASSQYISGLPSDMMEARDQFWSAVSPCKVDHVTFNIYYSTGASGVEAEYSMWYRRYDQPKWVLLGTDVQGSSIGGDSGWELYDYNLPTNSYYEFKVVCIQADVKVEWVQVSTSSPEQLIPSPGRRRPLLIHMTRPTRPM